MEAHNIIGRNERQIFIHDNAKYLNNTQKIEFVHMIIKRGEYGNVNDCNECVGVDIHMNKLSGDLIDELFEFVLKRYNFLNSDAEIDLSHLDKKNNYRSFPK